MRLRILDQSSHECPGAVRICLEQNEDGKSFLTDYLMALPSEDLSRELRWYYRGYLLEASAGASDDRVIARLLDYGQQLAEDLSGPFHELAEFAKRIEAGGYAELDVEIASADGAFWLRPWETLILPGSKYVLAAAARSFVRRTSAVLQQQELCHELEVAPPLSPSLTGLVQGMESGKGQPGQHGPERPLTILYLLSRPGTAGICQWPSMAFDAGTDTLTSEGALEYEVMHCGGLEQIMERIGTANRPIHLVHFDGPVELSGTGATLVMSDDDRLPAPISVEVLARRLAEMNVAVLGVDARQYMRDGAEIAARDGLWSVAEEALRAGLGNVLGLAEVTDPWTSAECLREVYRGCAKGLSTGQAVVEARKVLQSSTQVSRFTAGAKSFHRWPLLIHWSDRPVRFFSRSQTAVDAAESATQQRIAGKMLGFHRNMLPPLVSGTADGPIWDIIAHLTGRFPCPTPTAVALSGPPGSGKTWTGHRVCWNLVATRRVEYSFYFDCGRYGYSEAEALAMIGQVLSVNASAGDGSVMQRLQALRCAFVFDGLADPDALGTLPSELLQQGHAMILISRDGVRSARLPIRQWNIEPLCDLERRVLAAHALAAHKTKPAERDPAWADLLAACHGNPWLTSRAVSLLGPRQPTDLVRQLREHIGAQVTGSLMEDFLGWQWSDLSPGARRVLVLCAELEDVYLEILSAACDREEPCAAARELLTDGEQERTRFSDLIDLWERQGFVRRLAYGRTLDPVAVPFLRQRLLECADGQEAERARLLLSRCVCEGVRIVCRSLLKQPASPLAHHLLAHRGQWVRQLERLWLAGEFSAFISVLEVLEPLLRQGGCENEAAAWMLVLLGRSASLESAEAMKAPQAAWYFLAERALLRDEALESPPIIDGADAAWRWLLQANGTTNQAEPASYVPTSRFLETYFRKRSDWDRCVTICEARADVLAAHQAWRDVSDTLHSLSRYQLKRGDRDAAFVTETRILEGIPYDDASRAVLQHNILAVLIARISRGIDAQPLLDKLRALDIEQGRMAHVLDGLQADLHYQRAEYTEAMPLYCRLWTRALRLGGGASGDGRALQARFRDLQQRLGAESFRGCLDSLLPEGVARPVVDAIAEIT